MFMSIIPLFLDALTCTTASGQVPCPTTVFEAIWVCASFATELLVQRKLHKANALTMIVLHRNVSRRMKQPDVPTSASHCDVHGFACSRPILNASGCLYSGPSRELSCGRGLTTGIFSFRSGAGPTLFPVFLQQLQTFERYNQGANEKVATSVAHLSGAGFLSTSCRCRRYPHSGGSCATVPRRA